MCVCVTGVARRRVSTSHPSIPGIITSSSTRSGLNRVYGLERLGASVDGIHCVALTLEGDLQRFDKRKVVVNE